MAIFHKYLSDRCFMKTLLFAQVNEKQCVALQQLKNFLSLQVTVDNEHFYENLCNVKWVPLEVHNIHYTWKMSSFGAFHNTVSCLPREQVDILHFWELPSFFIIWCFDFRWITQYSTDLQQVSHSCIKSLSSNVFPALFTLYVLLLGWCFANYGLF